MVKIMIFGLCLTMPVISFGQESYSKVNNPQAEIAKLMAANKNVSTISCDFVQEKELSVLSETITSEGIFLLKDDDKLLWEYHTPYFYKVVINGDRMEIDDSDSKMSFDTRSNRMFREISDIIIKSVNGKIISDNTAFETELFENNKELLVQMKPKTKELGKLFNKIILHISKSNYLVSQIEMLEEQGDVTTIFFKKQKLNEPVETSLFDIH